MLKNCFPVAALLKLSISQLVSVAARKKTIGQKLDSVLKLMTLEEKIGQIDQYYNDTDSNHKQHPVYILTNISLL